MKGLQNNNPNSPLTPLHTRTKMNNCTPTTLYNNFNLKIKRRLVFPSSHGIRLFLFIDWPYMKHVCLNLVAVMSVSIVNLCP